MSTTGNFRGGFGPHTFQIRTLGCPVNQFEGRALAEAMTRAGFRETAGAADVYIVNSCAVTGAAAAEARRLIRGVKRDHPGSLVVLAGCYPQVYRAEIEDGLPEADLVVGTADRSRLPELVRQRLFGAGVPRIQVEEHRPGESFGELPLPARYGRARPVLKIQEGCDEACTYCIVRVARGRPRSMDPAQVLGRVRHLLDLGYREIVLAGTHLGAYGKDRPGWNLARIVREAGALSYDFRLRLDYVEPVDVSRDLLEAMASSSRVCPFLYLPLQSGSDPVLRKMGRRYTAGDYVRLVETARGLIPGLAVWTDLIAGFPGETPEDHAATVSLVRQLAFARLHVFPYSPRPGTAAASFPGQIAPDVKKKRVLELRALGRELSLVFHRGLVGKETRVLGEKVAAGRAEGHSERYVKVGFPAPGPALRGSLVTVRVTAAREWGVEGAGPEKLRVPKP